MIVDLNKQGIYMRVVILSSMILAISATAAPAADLVSGTYVEVRTCQVYTGPCFANGEVGSAGKNAIMTWKIDGGRFAGVDLAGQSVAVVVKASHTLGFKGLANAETKKAIVIIGSAADAQETSALKEFALLQTGLADKEIAGVHRADIDMQFDADKVTATVEIRDFARLITRKARKGDCICSNESAYYPPLTKLKGFVPGVTIEGEVKARRLGTRWSIPDSRTAYLGTFEIDAADLQLAESI
ncbi:MAG TPA: DUF1326 domain-containing protein [Planctomycetes bacterium]|nr:DUF1326 domain-containing protein [Fuerstiella sp.]HIK94052.1 DUF1326 domain-containing protein [Planctomycetota bacterium]